MDKSLLIWFVVIMIGLYKFCSLFNARYYEPSKMFLLPWIGCGLLLLLELITYDKIFGQSSFLTLTAGICCFVIGAVFYRMTHMRTALPRYIAPVYKFSPIILKVLLVGALVYSALEIFEILKFLISGGFGQTTLAELRAQHVELSNITTGRRLGNIPKSIGRSCAMVLSMAVPIFWFSMRRRRAILLTPLLILIIFEDLLNGARALTVFTLFGLGYVYLIAKPEEEPRPNSTRKFRKMPSLKVMGIGSVLVIGMIYYLFVFFPQTRNKNLSGDLNYFLAFQHDAEISQWVTDASQFKHLEWLPMLAYGTSYLSQPIVKYTFFTGGDDSVQNWYYLGRYNLYSVTKMVRILTGKNYWIKIRQRIAAYSADYGYSPNPWATGVRDLVIDFGYFGMMISLLFLGFIFQLLYHKAINHNSAEWIVLAALIALNCFAFAFISPLLLGSINQSFLLIAFLILLRKSGQRELR